VKHSPTGLDSRRPDADLQAWRAVVVFVLRDGAAGKLPDAVAGVARGMEVIEVVRLDDARRAAARHLLRDGGRGRGGHPVDGGGPHAYIIACDALPSAEPPSRWTVDARAGEVAARTTHRLLHGVAARDLHEPLHRSRGPQEAREYLEVLGDGDLPARVLARVDELAEACAFPFPVLRMLGSDSPGLRSRVALVDHPEHGRSVCKVFRPGAARYFHQELRARITLADLPLVPQLLEHGPNWLLTPEYTDDASHIVRRLPNIAGISQLRPAASRSLAGFARAMHERGLFMLDLSPQNLVHDPDAGLKVLDLEFVQSYADPPPPDGCYTFRGVPPELRTSDDMPVLALTRGVGNSVFHPAVAGARIETFLRPARMSDRLCVAVVQLGWFAAFATLAPLHTAVTRARRRGVR
jgi:hypothetical protein